MASSIAEVSTEDIGFAADILLDEDMDMRLLEADVLAERPENRDDGEADRGVEMSEMEEP